MSNTLFKDIDKSEDNAAIDRYVTTPTVEMIYESDKKAVDDILDGNKAVVTIKKKELEKKDPESLTGVEKLYLQVSEHFSTKVEHNVEGTEGLFSFLYGLIKRFFSMIGNFFKWLGETFLGFGKRSKTAVDALEAKIKSGEINYDTEVNYPQSAKLIIDNFKFKSYPNNLDWLRKELDYSLKLMGGAKKTFVNAKALFAKVQDKKVSITDVEEFGKSVARDLQTKYIAIDKKSRDSSSNATKLVGANWIYIQFENDTNALSFEILPINPTLVKESDKFSVNKAVLDDIKGKVEKTATALTDIGELSKQEKDLFGIKIKDAKDIEGMGKAEAYAMTAAVQSLVSYTSFIKNVLSTLQRSDTATHDILKKVFK